MNQSDIFRASPLSESVTVTRAPKTPQENMKLYVIWINVNIFNFLSFSGHGCYVHLGWSLSSVFDPVKDD